MPVKKKLKQSNEEVGVLKTCVHACIVRVKSHIASIPAYEIYTEKLMFCSLRSFAYVFLWMY